MQLWLRFYATDDERAKHAKDWPEDTIPPKEKPRRSRLAPAEGAILSSSSSKAIQLSALLEFDITGHEPKRIDQAGCGDQSVSRVAVEFAKVVACRGDFRRDGYHLQFFRRNGKPILKRNRQRNALQMVQAGYFPQTDAGNGIAGLPRQVTRFV